MTTTNVLRSYIGGRWIGNEATLPLPSAIDGHVAHTHAEVIDFAEGLHHARRRREGAAGARLPAARGDPQGAREGDRRSQGGAVRASHHTGATRSDGWIDIEGGRGTLFAYASVGGNELPSGNLIHEGPAIPVGKQGASPAAPATCSTGSTARTWSRSPARPTPR